MGSSRGYSIRERLNEFYRRLAAAPACRNAEEALALITRTIDEVEDDMTDFPKQDPPPHPGEFTGRLYPPPPDGVRRFEDGSIAARTRGHYLELHANGSIDIWNYRTDELEFTKDARNA